MEFEHEFSINDRRELDKISLETFTFNKANMFESSANSVMKKLIEDSEKCNIQQQRFLESYNKSPQIAPEEIDIDYESQLINYIIDNQYRDEELLALAEMKIIYLYKFFEINVKQLLRAAFSLNSTKEFYKWEELMNFIKNKNITPSKIKSYNELLQIKEVNNALKHHHELDTKLKGKIPELNVEKTTHKELEIFYERVKSTPLQFLKGLSFAIYDELYQFDVQKIDRMAKRVALRMGKEDALKLVEKIKCQY